MYCALTIVLMVSASASSQPLACINDSQCLHGFFCSQYNNCRQCLNCTELKRDPKPTLEKCITSVRECGPCFPGFVTDPSGNLDAQCVLAGTAGTAPGGGGGGGQGDSPNVYMWVLLGVGLLLVTVIVPILIYVYKHIDNLKVLATIRTSRNSTCATYRETDCGPGAGAGAGPVPGAPPPYYSAPPEYTPVRPTSPPLEHYTHTHIDEDAGMPFIENKAPRQSSVATARDNTHQAIPFNLPAIGRVRLPEQPPSYDTALSDEEAHPELHDEDTVESAWSPLPAPHAATAAAAAVSLPAAGDANNNTNQTNMSNVDVTSPGSAAELSTLLSEARGTTVVRPPSSTHDRRIDHDEPAAKLLCLRPPESNNFRALPESSEGADSQQNQPLNIKIVLQQYNNVKVINS